MRVELVTITCGLRVRRAARWRRQSSRAAQLTGSRGVGNGRPARFSVCCAASASLMVRAAELGVGGGVQQREQADEAFVRVGGVGAPSVAWATLGLSQSSQRLAGRHPTQMSVFGHLVDSDLQWT